MFSSLLGVVGLGLGRALIILIAAVTISIGACLAAARIARRGGHPFEFTDAVVFALLGGGVAGLIGPTIAQIVVPTPRGITLTEHWSVASIAGSLAVGLAIGAVIGIVLGIGAASDAVARDRARSSP